MPPLTDKWQVRPTLQALRWPQLGLEAENLRRLVVIGIIVMAAVVGARASRTLVVGSFGLLIAAAVIGRPKLWLPLAVLAAGHPEPTLVATSRPNLAMFAVAGLVVAELVAAYLRRESFRVPAVIHWPWIMLIFVSGLSILLGDAMWSPWVVVKDSFVFVQLAQWAIFALSACAFWLSAAPSRTREDLRWSTILLLTLGVVWLLTERVPGSEIFHEVFSLHSVVFRVAVVALASAFAFWAEDLKIRWRVLLLALAIAPSVHGFVFGRDWQSGWVPGLIVLMALGALRMGKPSRRFLLLSAGPLIWLLSTWLPRAASLDQWSMGTRLVAWRGLFELLEGRWLFGLGLASYWHYWRGIFGRMVYLDSKTHFLHFTYDPQVNMHNTYLDILGQMGVVGLLCVLWLLFSLVRYAQRQFRA